MLYCQRLGRNYHILSTSSPGIVLGQAAQLVSESTTICMKLKPPSPSVTFMYPSQAHVQLPSLGQTSLTASPTHGFTQSGISAISDAADEGTTVGKGAEGNVVG